jgi:hypothetical protein
MEMRMMRVGMGMMGPLWEMHHLLPMAFRVMLFQSSEQLPNNMMAVGMYYFLI